MDLRQRDPPIEIPALREVVRGAPCTFRIPGVQHAPQETTCWCHSNESRHGKGVGLKSHDIFGAIGCKACHDWYDLESRRTAAVPESYRAAIDAIKDSEIRRMIFDSAHIESLKWLIRSGHLKVVRDPDYVIMMGPG